MLNDIHSQSYHQPRIQNDDQQVATLEEDRPLPHLPDPFSIDNFEAFEENEYDRLVVDLNRDILLNDLENYDNSFITNLDRVQPHLVIYNLPEQPINQLCYEISNFHKLSSNECRVLITLNKKKKNI